MGFKRELKTNHGTGSGYPADGHAPAVMPKTSTLWSSAPQDGNNVEDGRWLQFTSADCLGTCREYKEWLDKIMASGVIPPDSQYYYYGKNIIDYSILLVSPGLPDRNPGPQKHIGIAYYVVPNMTYLPAIHRVRVFEGVPPFFKASFLYQEPFSVGVGQYDSWTYTAKPNTLKLNGYRLATKSGSSDFFASYDTTWGEAILGPDNVLGYKTYLRKNNFIMQHFVGVDVSAGRQVFGKFKGEFQRCYFNAAHVVGEEFFDCELFDMNVLAAGDVPKYKIEGKKVHNTVIAMKWGNLTLADATDSLVRLNQIDFICTAELDTSSIAMTDETVVPSPLTGKIEAGRIYRTNIQEGSYTLPELYANLCTFYKSTINLQKLAIEGVKLENMMLTGQELTLTSAIEMKDSRIDANGKVACRNTSIKTNSNLILGDGAVIEYSNLNNSRVTLETGAVAVSCSFENGGTVTVRSGAQIEGCWISTNAIVFINSGAKIQGVDLALKSEWNINDGNPNAEIGYTPITEIQASGQYGIRVSEIDTHGCIIEQETYDALSGAARGFFIPYQPTVDDYSGVIDDSTHSPEYLDTESQRLWKATEELPQVAADELEALGITLGCAARKAHWPIPVPYTAGTVVDPRT